MILSHIWRFDLPDFHYRSPARDTSRACIWIHTIPPSFTLVILSNRRLLVSFIPIFTQIALVTHCRCLLFRTNWSEEELDHTGAIDCRLSVVVAWCARARFIRSGSFYGSIRTKRVVRNGKPTVTAGRIYPMLDGLPSCSSCLCSLPPRKVITLLPP